MSTKYLETECLSKELRQSFEHKAGSLLKMQLSDWKLMQMQIRLLTSMLFMAGLCTPVRAADWPRFRGPNGSGVSYATGLPVEFDSEKNVLWKATLPPGHSSPVVAGDHVFLTACEKDKLLTICLDRQSGKILWRREIVRVRSAAPRPSLTKGKGRVNIYSLSPSP